MPSPMVCSRRYCGARIRLLRLFNASEKANALEGIFSQQEMADMRKAYELSGYSGFLRKETELRQQHLT